MRDSCLTEVSGSFQTRSLSPGVAEKRLSISDDDDDDDDDDESDSRSEEMSIHAITDPTVRTAPAVAAQHEERTSLARALETISLRLGAMKRPKNNLFVAATVALVLLFVSAGFLLLRANLLYSRLTDLTADTQLLTGG